MEEHVTEFVKQCLQCMDSKAEKKVPRPLGETRLHGTRPGEVVHSDSLYVGASGSMGDDGLGKDGVYGYILVMMDDASNRVWLEPMGASNGPLDSSASLGLVQDHRGSGGVGE